jgi:uncharacterized protein YjbI with pentapeptide repeats
MSDYYDLDNRWDEIMSLGKNNHFCYRIFTGAVLIGIGVLIGLGVFAKEQTAYWMSLCTNALALGFGVFVLDQLAKKRAEDTFKRDLIYKMGSRVNDEAVRASEQLRREGWLQDGSLRKQKFEKADLANADLRDADLQGAHFVRTNLRGVDLSFADLSRAYLYGADLQNTTLGVTKFDKRTMLPDGSFWKPDTDMRRFTDPTHPNFWRSDDPTSPAYRSAKAQ